MTTINIPSDCKIGRLSQKSWVELPGTAPPRKAGSASAGALARGGASLPCTGCGFPVSLAAALRTQKLFCLVSHHPLPAPLLFSPPLIFFFPLYQFLFTVLWIKLLHNFLCSCGSGPPVWRWALGPLDLSFLSCWQKQKGARAQARAG